MRTTTKFGLPGGSAEGEFERYAISATLERDLGAGFSAQLGVGVGFGGQLEIVGETHDFGVGGQGFISGAYRILDGSGYAPFVIGTLSVGVGLLTTKERGVPGAPEPLFVAPDARVGLTVGKLFWNAVAPYAAGRAFGGPISWEHGGQGVTGSDANNYQIAFGLFVTAIPWFDVNVEVAPLGESALSVNAARAF